jgi:hypothetical protein
MITETICGPEGMVFECNGYSDGYAGCTSNGEDEVTGRWIQEEDSVTFFGEFYSEYEGEEFGVYF